MLWEYILFLIFSTHGSHASGFSIAYLLDLVILNNLWDHLIDL